MITIILLIKGLHMPERQLLRMCRDHVARLGQGEPYAQDAA